SRTPGFVVSLGCLVPRTRGDSCLCSGDDRAEKNIFKDPIIIPITTKAATVPHPKTAKKARHPYRPRLLFPPFSLAYIITSNFAIAQQILLLAPALQLRFHVWMLKRSGEPKNIRTVRVIVLTCRDRPAVSAPGLHHQPVT